MKARIHPQERCTFESIHGHAPNMPTVAIGLLGVIRKGQHCDAASRHHYCSSLLSTVRTVQSSYT